jgi:translation elongation factor aEF-1 beta
MARVIITLRVRPESPDSNLKDIQDKADEAIFKFAAEKSSRIHIHEMAFGLKELEFIFTSDEAKGDTEPLEKVISGIPGVGSVEVTDVRRSVG